MATMNPFDLLGDFDNDDPSQLIAKLPAPKAQPPAQSKLQAAAQPKPAKLPTKPLPPALAVREAMNGAARGGGGGGGGGGGRGYGRGRGGPGGSVGGYRRDFANDEKSFSNSAVPAGQGAPEDGDGKKSERRDFNAPRGPYHGGRRGGFGNGEGGDERPRRVFERRSGTGRGNEFKREGSGRGNWGTQTDEVSQVNEEAVNESEKNLGDEKPAGEEEAEGNKENPIGEPAEKEPEEKEMTLEEYQKLLEEKRKTLQALKTEERKVDTKEFESMQQLSNKKENYDVFIKLGSDKDKKKEAADKEDKAKKAVSINEFLKPAEGERNYNPGGRGRDRGRGSRGGYSGGSRMSDVVTPSIEDPRQFPTLGAK